MNSTVNRNIVLLLLIMSALLGCTQAETHQNVAVKIELPVNNDRVELTGIVRGKVSSPDVQVYVLIHPMATNLWWVQRLPSPPNPDGLFQTLVYYGTDTEGTNESYEVLAIVSSKSLSEGETLQRLPKYIARSSTITVTRSQ